MISRLVKATQTGLLIIVYPLIIYLLLSYQLAWLGVLLVLILTLWKLHHFKNGLWWALALLAGVAISARLLGIDSLLKLSPLLIHSSLLILFSRSLRSTPLITRFATLEHGGELPPGVASYCRRLTILWAGFFAANIAGGIWLALEGDAASWALYNGLIVYLLIAALVVGEYLWRHVAFPALEIPSLPHSIGNMISNGHKVWQWEKHNRA